MKKTFFIFGLIVFIITSMFAQDYPKPEYFGVYLVSNNKLIEFSPNNADSLYSQGNIMNPKMGLKQLKGEWIKDSLPFFIVYGKGMAGKEPYIANLKWQDKVEIKDPITSQKQEVEVNMYLPVDKVILKSAPIKGMEDAYRYVIQSPLSEGHYLFSLKRRGEKSNITDATIEANSANNIWDFTISRGLLLNKSIKDCNLNNGEFTKPLYYGLWSIYNNELKQINHIHRKNIKEYDVGNDSTKLFGISDIEGNEFTSDQLSKHFIVYNENNLRKGISITVNFTYRPHKDIIPEKMYLSKLKKEKHDIRSKRQIRKEKSEIIEELWVPDGDTLIPFKVNISNFYNQRICQISLEKPLSPGVYALHNGPLLGKSYSCNISKVIYVFEVK